MTAPGSVTFRPMKVKDIDAIYAVQSDCYSGSYLETKATMLSRLRASPDTVWVAEDESGVCAYLFGYRSLLGTVTCLGESFDIPAGANSLYLHDLAVSRRIAGHGIGSQLVQMALVSAKQAGMTFSSLVALPSAREYWSRLGYRDFSPTEAAQRKHLASYPETVCCMVKAL